MPTVNEEWRDALVRHQIGLMRLSKGIVGRMNAILERTEEDLRQQIEQRVANINHLSPQGTARLRALEEQVKQIRGAGFDEVRTSLAQQITTAGYAEGEFLATALVTVAPVVLEPSIPDPIFVRNVVSREPMRGRLLKEWAATLQASDRRAIMDAIKVGLVEGEPTDRIVRRVFGTARARGADGVLQQTRNGMTAVVRTAINHIATRAKQEFTLANASTFTLELYSATLDGRTTKRCASLDGNTYPLGEGPYPPQHVACRSTRFGVIDDQFIGTRPAKAVTERRLLRRYTDENGLSPVRRRGDLPRGHKGAFDLFRRQQLRAATGQVPAGTTFDGWLRNQSREFQDDWLGPTRAKLFRAGMPLEKYTDRFGSEYTLAQLAERDASFFRAAGLDPDDFGG